MATPSSIFTELVTTTLRNHPAELADNMSNHNALWRRLSAKNRITMLDGGYEIVRPLEYAENQTYQRFSGYDVLNVGASDVLTAVKYPWRQAAVNVTASGEELRKNSGRERIIPFVKSRIAVAMKTMANNLSQDLYSAGLLTNQIGGIRSIIQDNGQGSVGGIDSATWTFWRNKFREAAGTNTISKSTIKGEMNGLWLTLVRGTDKPDLIVASIDFYSMYWESLQDLQRYTGNDNDMAKAGFQSLKYVSADVIHDTAVSGITDEHMYMLNTDYLELCVHRDANMTEGDEQRPINQDAVAVPVLWMGNLVCSNRALQGTLIDAA